MVTDLISISLPGRSTPAGELLLGPENRLALLAAEQLAAGDAPRLVVLYGPHGAGKTHLVHGLVAQWTEERPQQRAVYLTGTDYARAYAQACKADAVDDFAQRQRGCDLLVIDTVCELAGKTAAQLHLARTLDVLDRRGATVLLALRHCPSGDGDLAAALSSRLLGGWNVPLVLPAESTRLAIAQYFAAQRHVTLKPSAASVLAQRFRAGVGPIQSAVAQLAAAGSKKITTRDIDELLRAQSPGESPNIAGIAKLVAARTGVNLKDLRGPSRRALHVRARGLAMVVARRVAQLPYGQIGAYFGRRDHSTVMHACRKTEEQLDADHQLALLCEQVLESLDEHRHSPPPTP